MRIERLEARQLLAAEIGFALAEASATSADLYQQAGISSQAVSVINGLEQDWTEVVNSDSTMINALEAIASTETVPVGAVVITDVSGLSQIASGGTYLLQGDFTFTQTLEVPSNTTIYVDGSIYKAGGFVAPDGVHSRENYDDAIFKVSGTDNIRLIGINNARLHSTPDLDVNSPHTTAVLVTGRADDVLVDGFEIDHVWEGVVAHFGSSNVTIQNNYIHEVLGRSVWLLGTTDTSVVHNFLENTGMDGIDFDAYTADSIAYENVVVGAGRWAGFVEEGANGNFLVRGLAIMADMNNPNANYQLGWNDNGTGPSFTANNPGLFTRDNYFLDNVVFRPSDFSDGGDYLAKTGPGTQKGETYFWANRGYGAGQSITLFQNAQWLDYQPTTGGVDSAVNGFEVLADLSQRFGGSHSPLSMSILDFRYDAEDGFMAGQLNQHDGFVGQQGSIVNPSGSGTVTTQGGPYYRVATSRDLLSRTGQPNLAPGDSIEIEVDYQFQLSGFSNVTAGVFGIRDSIDSIGSLTPQQGFQVKFNTTQPSSEPGAGTVEFISGGVTTAINAFDLGLDPLGSSGQTDLDSDQLRLTYRITSDGAGNFSVDEFSVENLVDGSVYLFPNIPDFAFLDETSDPSVPSDLYYAQGLAFNGDTGFVGTSDGLSIEFIPGDLPDFGDAPASYPTRLADNGASHVPIGPRLGDFRDRENDGQPSLLANGDDLDDLTSDDDGVVFGTMVKGDALSGITLELQNAVTAKVDAWIDFDQDGVWQSDEKILDGITVSNAMQTFNYSVPSGALAGETFARVRVSSSGQSEAYGHAIDGEVEDYQVTIFNESQIEEITLNHYQSQRSNVDHVQVKFNQYIPISNADAAAAIELKNSDTLETVSIIADVDHSSGKTTIDVSFDPLGDSVHAWKSLVNGSYQLTIRGELVGGLDGDADGNVGGDYQFGEAQIDNFFRKYGDANGDRSVGLSDFAVFRSVFGTSSGDIDFDGALDSNGDGSINLSDFAAFRSAFGT